MDDLVANPDLRLLKLADTASLLRQNLTEAETTDLIGPPLWFDDTLGPVARRIAANALGIGSAPSRDQRVRQRGALLERLVHVLVEGRLPGVTFHEHEVQLTHNPRSRRQWTEKKEVVAAGPQFEVYECKSDGLPTIGDIDELSDIVTTANAEGTVARSTLVTLGSIGNLRIQAKAWRMSEQLFGVTADTVLGLRSAPPGVPIRPGN